MVEVQPFEPDVRNERCWCDQEVTDVLPPSFCPRQSAQGATIAPWKHPLLIGATCILAADRRLARCKPLAARCLWKAWPRPWICRRQFSKQRLTCAEVRKSGAGLRCQSLRALSALR